MFNAVLSLQMLSLHANSNSDQQEGFFRYDYSFLSVLLVFEEPKADVKVEAMQRLQLGQLRFWCCSYALLSFLGHPAQFYMWFLGRVFQPHSICRAPTEIIPFVLSGSSESTHPEERSLWKDYMITPPAALSQIRLLFFSLQSNNVLRERFCTISECGLQPGVPELWWTHPQNMQANKSSLSWRNFPRQAAQKALRWYFVSQSIRQC